ncbi:MAG TPA: ATP-dependent 6-phosphofructokinase [Bacteroidales bacterium]|nr:ATP-dependent 6-phosphofructokinase [Bacteroidales bacterium]
MTKYVGVLTSGGDNPGLNAAIRGLGKAALGCYGMQVIGFRDGFRGLMENRTVNLDGKMLSGILTLGGTILGTSRDKPHKMMVGGKEMDMTQVIIENYHKNHLDCLVCIGGGGTQKNAYRLMQHGLNVITLPKTIDNDVWGTDVTFGFDTALEIATEAIDRLHSTAQSHHRVIVVEIMGHRAGWLALGAGLSGGADVILIPEIPYDTKNVAESIKNRSRSGKSFSIVAVAEGALSKSQKKQMDELEASLKAAENKDEKKQVKKVISEIQGMRSSHTLKLAQKLEELTGIESRVTILGHLQRGGTPSSTDRLLATKLGTACVEFINQEKYGILVASKGEGVEALPLDQVAGKLKTLPLDHEWILSARRVGTCLGD